MDGSSLDLIEIPIIGNSSKNIDDILSPDKKRKNSKNSYTNLLEVQIQNTYNDIKQNKINQNKPYLNNNITTI